ncbi:hypothetical protein [Sulfitobacter sp. S190]|uniref:hypothetical protein n=1 Tax=Sulfitobacter sp. S190 TaxID=2867022 RepID=UPI0021A8D66B|nr:hypothetical protein [Sulfitobacter sp. S190]UWR23689.1 hypothetical protein K3756_06910 [Sulfitobacter sp. S190]
MATHQKSTECVVTCWGIAAAVGVLAMVMLWWMGDFSALQAIFTGGLIGFVLGLVLSLTICRPQTAAAALASEDKPADRYAREAAEKKAQAAETAHQAGTAGTAAGNAPTAAAPASASTTTSTSTGAAAAQPAAFVMQPSKKLAGQEELSARKGSWKYEGAGASAVEAQPDAPAAAPKPAAKKAAPKKAASADAAPAIEDGPQSEPDLYTSAPSGGGDDLKLISGVGPKLEQTLNDLGIYKFEQVAKWGPEEIAWVDARIRFKGRITRDDWMSQASTLAAGGETEFSSRNKK